MKKIIIIGIFLICISINTYNALNNRNCEEVIIPTSLNSKNLLNYIKTNNLTDTISRVCTIDLCKTINPTNIDREVADFIDSYYNYLKNKREDIYNEATLKGFRIDKIIITRC